MLLAGLIPDAADHGIVHDARGRAIALHPDFRHPWHLLALSGGHPLSVWQDGRLHNVDGDSPDPRDNRA